MQQLGRECKKQFCWAHAAKQSKASKQAAAAITVDGTIKMGRLGAFGQRPRRGDTLPTSPPLTKVRVSCNYWLSAGNTHSSPAAAARICPSSMDCLDTSHVSAASRHACATISIQGNYFVTLPLWWPAYFMPLLSLFIADCQCVCAWRAFYFAVFVYLSIEDAAIRDAPGSPQECQILIEEY
jgi:hypothetical protein